MVNEDGEDRYIKTGMKDDKGYDVEAYLDRDGGEIRKRTGQATEEEKIEELVNFYNMKDAKELNKASGGGGGGGGGGGMSEAKVKELMAGERAKDKEQMEEKAAADQGAGKRRCARRSRRRPRRGRRSTRRCAPRSARISRRRARRARLAPR